MSPTRADIEKGSEKLITDQSPGAAFYRPKYHMKDPEEKSTNIKAKSGRVEPKYTTQAYKADIKLEKIRPKEIQQEYPQF